MQRCQISETLLGDLRIFLKTGKANAKTRKWAKRWELELRKGEIYHQNKLLVPIEEVDQVLTVAIQNGMPTSRDGAMRWLASRFYGFKKRDVEQFLNSVETNAFTTIVAVCFPSTVSHEFLIWGDSGTERSPRIA